MGFSRDPEDKELLRMARVKNNLSRKRSGMKYRIEEVEITLADGSMAKVPHVEWAGECEEDADQLMAIEKEKGRRLGETTALDKAKQWLRSRLKDGPVESSRLFDEAKAAGISRDSLFRVKRQEGSGVAPAFKIGAVWFWSLTGPTAAAKMEDPPEIDPADL